MELRELFLETRCPTGWSAFFLILYSPVGVLFAALRLCVAFCVLVTARLLPHLSIFKSTILPAVFCSLGLVVTEEKRENRDKTTQVLVANHVSHWDALVFHISTYCHTKVTEWGLPLWISEFINIEDNATSADQQPEGSTSGSILLLPEGTTSSGRTGLLRFSPVSYSSVQPVAIKVRRHPIADVAPTTLFSSVVADLFWLLFVPYTEFVLRFLPVLKREEGEDDDTFTKRIQEAISSELQLVPTNYTAADKAEWVKRRTVELQQQAAAQRALVNGSSPELQRMVRQVAEVLPRVPRDIILRDLRRTHSVDITISNILEGQVSYEPLPETAVRPSASTSSLLCSNTFQASGAEMSPVSFPKSAQERMQSFHERKERLIENARQKYIEKHGLKVDLNC